MRDFSLNSCVAKLKDLDELRRPHFEKSEKIQRIVAPYSGNFTKDRYNQESFSNTHNEKAHMYCNQTAIMLAMGLVSSAQNWFNWEHPNSSAEWDDGRLWLTTLDKTHREVLAASNWYLAIQHCFSQLVIYGVGVIGTDIDRRGNKYGIPYFTSLVNGEFWLEEDEYKEFSTVVRKMYMAAEEVFGRWGDKCSRNTQKLAKEQPLKKVEIYQMVSKREIFGGSLNKLDMPYASIWFEKANETNEPLEIGGFKSMPYKSFKWYAVDGSPWALGIGWDIARTAKYAQEIVQAMADGSMKSVLPPLLVSGQIAHQLRLEAGAITATDNPNRDAIIPLLPAAPDVTRLIPFADRLENDMRQISMNDVLLIMLQDNPVKTATEVLQIQQEKMQLLGAVVYSILKSIQDIQDKVFTIIQDAEMLPPPPPSLQGANIQMQFIGPVAQAQRQVGIQNIISTIRIIGEFAQIKPEALDKLDADQTVDIITTQSGLPAGMINNDETVAQIRAQRAEIEKAMMAQEEQQVAAQVNAQNAKSVKDLSSV